MQISSTQQRVLDECAEMAERIEWLDAHCREPAFSGLPAQERDAWLQQRYSMVLYREAMHRLLRFWGVIP